MSDKKKKRMGYDTKMFIVFILLLVGMVVGVNIYCHYDMKEWNAKIEKIDERFDKIKKARTERLRKQINSLNKRLDVLERCQ